MLNDSSTKRWRIDRTLARSDRRLRPRETELLRIVGMDETPEAPARITQDVLARRLDVKRESVSRLVARLEARGLLVTEQERQPDGRWGQLGYRLPEPWDEEKRHTVRAPETSHGQEAGQPAEDAANAASASVAADQTSHGAEGENVTTTAHQGTAAARDARQVEAPKVEAPLSIWEALWLKAKGRRAVAGGAGP